MSTPPSRSTLSVATLDADGVARYDFWTSGSADWQWTEAELAAVVDDEPDALHTGSLTLELEPGRSRIIDLLARVDAGGRTTISYDPNVRMAKLGPVEAGRAAVERVVPLAHLVKVSTEDLAWLYPGEEPVAAASRWAAAGPELVVVTLGRDGAVALGPDRRPVHRDAPPVERGGHPRRRATRSAPGCSAALAERGALGRGKAGLAGVDLPAVLDRAILVASLTCARSGADPPTLAEVAEAENPRPGVVELTAAAPDGRSGAAGRRVQVAVGAAQAGALGQPVGVELGEAAAELRVPGGVRVERLLHDVARVGRVQQGARVHGQRRDPVRSRSTGCRPRGPRWPGPGRGTARRSAAPPRAAPRTAARRPGCGRTARPRAGSGNPRTRA